LGNVTTADVIGNTVPVTANSILTPFVDPNIITFEDLELGSTFAQNARITGANGAYLYQSSSAGALTVVEDYDGDKAVQPQSGAYIWLYSGNENTDTYNTSILDADINFTSTTFYQRDSYQVRVGTGGTTQFTAEWGWIYNDGDGSNAEFAIRVNDSIAGTNSGWIKMGVTGTSTPKFNLKIEYVWTTGQIRVTVDGNVIYNDIISASTTPIFRTYYISNASNTVVLDNIKALNTYVDPTGFATAE